MAVTILDMYMQQLAQQAILYDLTFMINRKKSTQRVENFFYKIHEILPITASLEIGAYEASFSKTIQEKFSHISSRAFEANPEVYAHFLLDESIKKSNIEYSYLAIGNKDGTSKFFLADTFNSEKVQTSARCHSLLERKEENTSCSFVYVPIKKLDTVCSKDKENSIYSLWIDAEGATKQVLQGAEKILQKTAAIYVELESTARFKTEENVLDRDIFQFLLDRDFIPVLRDFQFRHQYNVIFVKKEYMTEIEHEYHKYFNSTLRKCIAEHFSIQGSSGEHIPVEPKALESKRYSSVKEIQEQVEGFPLLREPRIGLDYKKSVVVCHARHLEEAISYYKKELKSLPEFYVLFGINDEKTKRNDVNIHDFYELPKDAEIQMFFPQSTLVGKSGYPHLAMALTRIGFQKFYIERSCTEKFYRRNSIKNLDEKQWHTVLNFTNKLADAHSKYSYLSVIKALSKSEPGYIPLAPYSQYYHPKVQVEPYDILCEGGIDNGDTSIRFINSMQEKGKVYAFELFEDNWKGIEEKFLPYKDNCILIKQALWKESGKIYMTGLTPSSMRIDLSDMPSGISYPCTSIDDFFKDKERVSCIKLDVEGAESYVLEGAKKTIEENSPKLLLSIYHQTMNPDHLYIPQMLMDMDLDYDFYCGHHRPWYNETIVYGRKRI